MTIIHVTWEGIMNKKLLSIFLISSLVVSPQEHKNTQHVHHKDFTINIEGLPDDIEIVMAPERDRSPTPPRHEHHHHHHKKKLCSTKVKVAIVSGATTVIVTVLVLILKYYH